MKTPHTILKEISEDEFGEHSHDMSRPKHHKDCQCARCKPNERPCACKHCEGFRAAKKSTVKESFDPTQHVHLSTMLGYKTLLNHLITILNTGCRAMEMRVPEVADKSIREAHDLMENRGIEPILIDDYDIDAGVVYPSGMEGESAKIRTMPIEKVMGVLYTTVSISFDELNSGNGLTAGHYLRYAQRIALMVR